MTKAMKFDKDLFAKRRKQLIQMLGDDDIAIIPSAIERIRNRDVEHQFRQDSDFFYLTGFDEPDAVVVLIPNRAHAEFILFCRDKDPEKELWVGRRAGPEGACSVYGADDAFPIDDIDDILPGMLEGKSRLFYTLGQSKGFDAQLLEWVNKIRSNARRGEKPPGEFVSLNPLLHEMRLIKSHEEIKRMKKAAKITAEAHCSAMKAAKKSKFEYQLEAEINYVLHKKGCKRSAYPAIVGCGDNACILHYTENNMRLNDGELVLIDAGGEYDYYAADITRTFPISGTFSHEQAALYNIVLEAQLKAIEYIKPNVPWNTFHEIATEVITQGLIDLGLLEGSLGELIEQQAYRPFFMHKTGHWLGMDVHDVGDYKIDQEWRLLEPGMVLTVEPGIYVSPTNMNVDKKWRGIGIRIEDDVLVTKTGCDVLTGDVPKTIADIEALMA